MGQTFFHLRRLERRTLFHAHQEPEEEFLLHQRYGEQQLRTIRSVRSRRVINEPQASDHRPVQVEVTLNRYSTPVSAPRAEAGAGQGAFYDLSGKRQAKGNLLPGLYIQEDKARKVLVMK